MNQQTDKNYQDISIGVKVSEELIKNTVALQVAKQLEGNTEAVLTKMIIGILNFKKDSYSSSPTMIQELVEQNLRPLIANEAKKWFDEMSPEISKMVQKTLKQNVTKDKIFEQVQKGLAEAVSKSVKIQIGGYY